MSLTTFPTTPWWNREGASVNAEQRRDRFAANLVEVADQLGRLGWEVPTSADPTRQAVASRIDRLAEFLQICREELLPLRAGDGDVDAADLAAGAPARVTTLAPVSPQDLQTLDDLARAAEDAGLSLDGGTAA